MEGGGVSPFNINPSGGFSFWCHLIERGGVSPPDVSPLGVSRPNKSMNRKTQPGLFMHTPRGGGCSLQTPQSPMTSPQTPPPHLQVSLAPPAWTIRRFCHSTQPCDVIVTSSWHHHGVTISWTFIRGDLEEIKKLEPHVLLRSVVFHWLWNKRSGKHFSHTQLVNVSTSVQGVSAYMACVSSVFILPSASHHLLALLTTNSGTYWTF